MTIERYHDDAQEFASEIEEVLPIALHAVTIADANPGKSSIYSTGDMYDTTTVMRDDIYQGGVLHDRATKLYIKLYPNRADAELQYATMNALQRRLAQEAIGITTVRHLALLSTTPDGAAAAIIEPAAGTPAKELPMQDRASIALRTQRTIDATLGRNTARLLVNDLNRPRNVAGNIFIRDLDETRHLTLIDQPFYNIDMTPRKVRKALIRLGMHDDADRIAALMRKHQPQDSGGLFWW